MSAHNYNIYGTPPILYTDLIRTLSSYLLKNHHLNEDLNSLPLSEFLEISDFGQGNNTASSTDMYTCFCSDLVCTYILLYTCSIYMHTLYMLICCIHIIHIYHIQCRGTEGASTTGYSTITLNKLFRRYS